MDPLSVGLTATSLVSLLKNLFGGNSGLQLEQTEEQKQTNREMNQILAEQKARMMYQTPLYQAITQLAMGLMPKRYQQAAPGSWYNTPAPGTLLRPDPNAPNPGDTIGNRIVPNPDLMAEIDKLPEWRQRLHPANKEKLMYGNIE